MLFNSVSDKAPEKFNQAIPILSPVNGKSFPLTDFPNPLIASGLLGGGVAVYPAGHQLLSPIKGRVEEVSATGEKLRLRSSKGINLYMQFQLDYNHHFGEGFQLLTDNHQQVEAGQPLIQFSSFHLKKLHETFPLCVCVANSNKMLGVQAHYHQMEAMQDNLLTLFV
jgi:phosphotransferase system IIA component